MPSPLKPADGRTSSHWLPAHGLLNQSVDLEVDAAGSMQHANITMPAACPQTQCQMSYLSRQRGRYRGTSRPTEHNKAEPDFGSARKHVAPACSPCQRALEDSPAGGGWGALRCRRRLPCSSGIRRRGTRSSCGAGRTLLPHCRSGSGRPRRCR